MTNFTNLMSKTIEEITKEESSKQELINTPEKLTEYLKRINKKYKKDPEKHIMALFRKEAEASRKEKISQIASIEEAPDFSGEFVITIEWKKSRMWGSNPSASTNQGFEGSSIGGCGYDKLSTATAQALNSNKSLLKLLYEKKNANIDIKNHVLLGYGSGYDILPQFEGGVGYECYKHILEKLGINMRRITNTDSIDVFMITK